MNTFPPNCKSKKTMSSVSVASSTSMVLDDLKSRYTCIQEPLSPANASRSDDNGRYLTSLRVYESPEVDEPQSPLLTNDQHIIDPQRVIEKVAAALKALSFREPRVLVQFWSPVSVRKRSLLTTLDQPFGLGVIDEELYRYRLESEQRMFVVDEEHREELGPPGRVYCQKLPEWSFDMHGLSTRQDWGSFHNIRGYINLPVFEPSIGRCVGVLELITSSNYADYAYEVRQVSRALKEENLKSPNVFEDNSFYARVGDEKRQHELDEIFQAIKMVCDIQNLPLGQTWGPCGYSSTVAHDGNLERSCSSFSRTCIGKVCMSTTGLPFYVRDLSMWEFHETCRARHLDKSQGFVGRSLSSRGLCFCEDASQLSEEEYPLVPYARMHGITSCLAIYLKSVELDDEYVAVLYLPAQSENEADLQSLIKTVKQQITSASSIQLGDMSSILDIWGIPLLEFSTLTEDLHPLVESENNDFVVYSKKESGIAYVEEDDRSNSVAAGKRREKCVGYSETPVRKRSRNDGSISLQEIQRHYGKTFEEAANSLGVSRSALKRICRSHGILRSKSSMENVCDNYSEEKINLLKEDAEANRDSDSVVPTDAVHVYVRFKDSIVKFRFLHSDRLLIWESKVANRFKIEGTRACLKYKDEDGDWIFISVDEDLKFYLSSSSCMNLICEPADM